ncbi:MAG TPA: hypothetical protein VML19_09280 [Verrucomicrobiae bacterium]|nr:hypothetical protein [Verrucomicrobiae bacterium]
MKGLLVWAAILAWTVPAGAQPVYRIDTVAGSSLSGDGGPATSAELGSIQGIAIDHLGNLYLSDTDNHRIRKVSPGGIITTIAGTGIAGFSGDGGPAASAQLNLPYGLAADLAGNLYIADLGNNRVRRIAPDGTISTIAGGGALASVSEGDAAANSQLLTPRNVAVDAAGSLYISEFSGHRVRKVTTDGRIFTAAGTGVAGFWGDGGPSSSAQLAYPAGLAADRNGNLYIADSGNQRIRKILPGNIMSTVLGGAPSTALFTPIAVTVDAAGAIYVADSTGTVHQYPLGGPWTLAAGAGAPGFSGDGGLAPSAHLTAPRDLAVDLYNNLYIADGVRVREINSSDIIRTVAGDGYLHAIGDGSAATSAQLFNPSAVALDYSGSLYIADTGTNRIRRVSPSGIITTIAGDGVAAFKGDLGPAASSELNAPASLALDSSGNIIVADTANQRVRKIASGSIWTVLGTGTAGSGPENTAPLQTPVRSPAGLCFDLAANQYIADTLNNRILLAPPGALVATYAGNGAAGSLGDGGIARTAQLNRPAACAVDAAGNLFIADTGNHLVRKVTPAGNISTVAGTGAAGSGGDEGPASAAQLNAPRGVAVDGSGDVFIADTGSHRIRMITPDGVMHTIAGTGAAGFAGDGAGALPAELNSPAGLVVDGSGNVYFADSGNNRVRRLTQTAASTQLIIPPVNVPQPLVVQNAASQASGTVAPGELVIISGAGLGPQAGVAGLFDSAGLVANIVAGTEIHFDGVPAPVFYTQFGQVTVQVPYTVAGSVSTHLEAFYLGQSVNTADVAVAASAPGLFPVALNQDGSTNSASNPVAAGSTIVLNATGEGMTNGANTAGLPAAAPYASPLQPVVVSFSGEMAQITYAAAAPGLVGVLQVNAVVPADLPPGQTAVTLSVGATSSQAIPIWAR